MYVTICCAILLMSDNINIKPKEEAINLTVSKQQNVIYIRLIMMKKSATLNNFINGEQQQGL